MFFGADQQINLLPIIANTVLWILHHLFIWTIKKIIQGWVFYLPGPQLDWCAGRVLQKCCFLENEKRVLIVPHTMMIQAESTYRTGIPSSKYYCICSVYKIVLKLHYLIFVFFFVPVLDSTLPKSSLLLYSFILRKNKTEPNLNWLSLNIFLTI